MAHGKRPTRDQYDRETYLKKLEAWKAAKKLHEQGGSTKTTPNQLAIGELGKKITEQGAKRRIELGLDKAPSSNGNGNSKKTTSNGNDKKTTTNGNGKTNGNGNGKTKTNSIGANKDKLKVTGIGPVASGEEYGKHLVARKKKMDAKAAAKEKAAWLKKTRNSPAAKAGFSDDERWALQQKHRKWKADRKAGKLKKKPLTRAERMKRRR